MKNLLTLLMFSLFATIAFGQLDNETTAPRAKTISGIVEGTNVSGIRVFKGVPFAAPPVGNLRWREPQPVKDWIGVRKADKFGPRAVQRAIFSDMVFRSSGMSEDCLYLNIWTPAKTGKEHLPVLVYFYGGGYVTGDGSELRYDGESMSRKGMVVITVNYRLGVFGFFAHPELTKESPHHASGNYGLLDQAAALKWVQQNITAFGGDPKKVTIAGESAGSFSVSAQMASPLSKNLIAGAIGESGSLLGTNPPIPLNQAEQLGVKFGSAVSANLLSALRAIPAEQLLEATAKADFSRFPVTVDGYFLPKSPLLIYANGEQAHVPLLVGWNSEENNYKGILGKDKPTVENFTKAIQKLYGEHADEALKAYNVAKDEDVEQVATELASNRFISFSTWKWSDTQSKTGTKPVYRYFYTHPRPVTRAEMIAFANGANDSTRITTKPPTARGAVHSAEIEYAMGNLATNKVFDWQPEDYKISEIMQSFFVNFIKTGNPNGLGVPIWPAVNNSKVELMYIDVNTRAEQEKNRQRYLFMDKYASK